MIQARSPFINTPGYARYYKTIKCSVLDPSVSVWYKNGADRSASMEGISMKIKIAQKDIVGYIFLLVVAAACFVIGARVLHNHHPASGAFSLALGFMLVIATASMVLRKD